MDTEDGIKISEFPSTGVIHNSDVVTGLHAGENYNFTFSRIMAWFKDAVIDLFVPTTREINGQDLSSDIDLTAEDVGAAKPDIIASIETDTGHQAQKNYSVGEMMIVPGGILCVAIAPISIGDSLISDTNIKEVTVSDRIMEVEGEIPSSPEDIGAVGTNIIARVETSQTSEHYYLEGQYLILSGLLYRTSTIIDIGDTIAVGSNVVLATVGGELESIKAIIPTQASDIGAVDSTDVGVADGVASLDSNGILNSSQAPPASDIDYDNTSSGLVATKVQGAIDEVYGAIPSDASDVDYDNTTSGLSATNVQSAVDEVASDVADKQATITASGILKGDGAGGVSAAVAGTDYQAPLTAGTDYATPAQLADKAAKADLTNIQATGATNTTGAAIPAGAYFYLNGVLYRAKTQIDVNATFTVNTNCEQVTEGGLNSFHCLSGDLSTDITGVYMRFGSLVTVYLGTCLVAINGSSYTNMGNLPFACYQGINTNVYGNDREYVVDIAANSRVLRIKWIGGAALPSSGKPSIRGIVQYITTE